MLRKKKQRGWFPCEMLWAGCVPDKTSLLPHQSPGFFRETEQKGCVCVCVCVCGEGGLESLIYFEGQLLQLQRLADPKSAGQAAGWRPRGEMRLQPESKGRLVAAFPLPQGLQSFSPQAFD